MLKPRVKRAADTEGGAYFSAPKSSIRFISSGCSLLDSVLGGGYPLGRIVNLVGDKSTGKTLLAIEGCANFAKQYEGKIWYNEIEAAFDKGYAEALGLPLDRVEFVEGCYTVEDLFEHLELVLQNEGDKEGLYIIDSLDALSDRAELGRKIDEGSYGANKPKQMGQLFRRLNQLIEKAKLCIIVISQVRDAIGVTFGEKNTRSGGRALDFYASQAIWLSQIKTLKKTINKVERPIGVQIRAKCKKNKVGLPLRSCDFPIIFGYGVDDITANLEWLESIERLDAFDLDAKPGKLKFLTARIDKLEAPEYNAIRTRLAEVVEAEWFKIEKQFIPARRKY